MKQIQHLFIELNVVSTYVDDRGRLVFNVQGVIPRKELVHIAMSPRLMCIRWALHEISFVFDIDSSWDDCVDVANEETPGYPIGK